MSGATGNPQWHEGQIAQNPSNTARRNPKPDKHHVESRDNLVEISEESPIGAEDSDWQGYLLSPDFPLTDRCAKRLTFAELQPSLGEERTDQLGLLTQTTDRTV